MLTVRTQKTAREEKEEAEGSTEQQKALSKEHNRSLHPLLSSLKLDHNTQLEWGKLYLISDSEVLQAAWKDQNIVLFMSTVSSEMETVERLRRRPAKTATNARTSRQIFGDEATKKLLIPAFIDNYNYFMGAVDQADQLRSYYSTLRKHNKNWKPLWHFLFDTTVINCYKLYRHHPRTPIAQAQRLEQKNFRIKLAIALFDHSKRTSFPAPAMSKPLTRYVVPDVASQHQHAVLSAQSKGCIVCKVAGRRPADGTMKRKALGELSHNIQRPSQAIKRRKLERKKTRYGCTLCRVTSIPASRDAPRHETNHRYFEFNATLIGERMKIPRNYASVL